MCSNCADSLPSLVVAVHASGLICLSEYQTRCAFEIKTYQTTSRWSPSQIIGSMVKQCPGFKIPTALLSMKHHMSIDMFVLGEEILTGIMRNVGWRVEKLIDAMSNKCAHHRESIIVCMVLNDLAKFSVSHTRFNYIPTSYYLPFPYPCPILASSNCLVQTFTSTIHQLACRLAHIANTVCLIHIAMESTIVAGNVNVDNITIFQRTLIRNTMANY